jgi:hypothetical protein
MHFAGGLRLKVKGARYLDLFRLVSSFTKEKVVQAILEGHYDDLYGQVPEEFRHEMVTVRDEFLASVSEFQLKCETAWEAAPKGGPEDKQARKDFALWVRQNAQPNLHGTLFKLYSGDSADYPRILAKQMFA